MTQSSNLVLVRLGSTTSNNDVIEKRKKELKTSKEKIVRGKKVKLLDYSKMNITEINTVEGIKNSSDKLLMKRCFTKAGTKTADWWTSNGGQTFTSPDGNNIHIDQLPFPLVVKHRFGSRNRGNTLVNNVNELQECLKGKTISSFIFERFYNFNREYRLHVNKFGCFYTCRKMLKSDTPDDKRWFKNDSNSVWIMEENPSFDKPTNFNLIIEDCKKTLPHLGLDFAAFDIRVQSSSDKKGKQRENPEYIIIESNSAPSFGDVTSEKYMEMLPKLIQDKLNQ